MQWLRGAGALARACHPGPALAVTLISAGLAALAGLAPSRAGLVVAAVLTGQLSIGWSNDALDAARDAAVRRPGKPAATGAIAGRLVWAAALVALAASVAASVALGRAGAVSLLTVGSAWSYNLRLKSTAISWLPYATSFGLLPSIATLAGTPPRWPAVWATVAGALLGVAAHLANVLPDLTDDAATGVHGLPHRLGARRTAVLGAGVLLAGSAVILFGPGIAGQPWRPAGFVVATAVAAAAVSGALRDPTSRRYFAAVIGIVGLDLVFFALSGSRL
jgi:4-hydroxybenzoate polyprenyltransferase